MSDEKERKAALVQFFGKEEQPVTSEETDPVNDKTWRNRLFPKKHEELSVEEALQDSEQEEAYEIPTTTPEEPNVAQEKIPELSVEVKKQPETLLNQEIQDFGFTRIPKDLTVNEVIQVIKKALIAEDAANTFENLGTIDTHQQSVSTQYFEYQDQSETLKLGCLRFIHYQQPVIFANDFVIDGGSDLEKIDWRQAAHAFDDQDGDISRMIRCDYQAVNPVQDGVYPVTYSVVNSRGEASQLVVWMRVRILKAVLSADDITMTASKTPNRRLLMAQVTAKDVIDGNLIDQVTVDDTQVKYERAGTYKITYRVKNSFGLESVAEKELTIEPQEPELLVSPLNLQATKVASEIDWLAHVSAVDPIDGDITHQVAVDNHQVDLQRGGTYPVAYRVTNSNGKTITAHTKATVVVPQPTIEATTFEIERGSNLAQVDWLSHVKATDEDGQDLSEYVTTFYEEVNPNEAGEYNLYYLVRNSYQQQAVKRVTVSVK